MSLFERTYGDIFYTESFIEREFNRSGLNKIGFDFKFKFLIKSLAETHYELKIMIPPSLKSINIIRKFPPKEIMYQKVIDDLKRALLEVAAE
jgi:hypothetical protein